MSRRGQTEIQIATGQHIKPVEGRGRIREEDAHTSAITDTWPAVVPVLAIEIEVVETFLGKLIDQLFSEE